MTDYTIFYKKRYSANDVWEDRIEADVLISGFERVDRVQEVFLRFKANASDKHWLLFDEYGFDPSLHPTSGVTHPLTSRDEATAVRDFLDQIDLKPSHKICVDITGILKPYLFSLLRDLVARGFRSIEILYSEPVMYRDREASRFSDELPTAVRQLAGFQGDHVQSIGGDYLIIGVGYDHKLLAYVCDSKEKAHKIELFGLPSLQPDMYQESVLRSQEVADTVGITLSDHDRIFFAPANDPFVTAAKLREIVKQIKMTNLYLCPLGTKAQALGFLLYYLYEGSAERCSVIYPIVGVSGSDPGVGFSKLWHYSLEFPR